MKGRGVNPRLARESKFRRGTKQEIARAVLWRQKKPFLSGKRPSSAEENGMRKSNLELMRNGGGTGGGTRGGSRGGTRGGSVGGFKGGFAGEVGVARSFAKTRPDTRH